MEVALMDELTAKDARSTTACNPGIDEMSKSEIEKRKRNMESISRISRREKRNVEICFLVREENENFCKKIKKSAIISLMWKREGFFSF